jgi:hypothetical protein
VQARVQWQGRPRTADDSYIDLIACHDEEIPSGRRSAAAKLESPVFLTNLTTATSADRSKWKRSLGRSCR